MSVHRATEVVTLTQSATTLKEVSLATANQDTPEMDLRV